MATATFTDRDGCPLCASRRYSTHLAFQDIPVLRCDDCRFLYSGRILAGDELEDSYRDVASTERHRKGQRINAACNAWAIERLLGRQRIDHLLDVGAGLGYLLAAVGKRRSLTRAVGVELSRADARYGRERLGQDVIDQPLATSGLAHDSFDLVTAFEVIEHTPRPLDFLAELARYARPGGYVLVATDNFEGRAARALGAGLPKWIPYSHISHFGPDTMAQAIQATPGLETVRYLAYTPWELRLRMLRGGGKDPSTHTPALTGLASATGGDSRDTFRAYGLRRWLNPLWLRLTAREDPGGDLMYWLARKAVS